MNNLKKDLNSEKDQVSENALRNALKQALDNDLRSQIKSDLAGQIGLSKATEQDLQQKTTKPIKTKQVKWIRWVSGIAASLVILVSAYFLININHQTVTSLSYEYALASAPKHPGLTKGIGTANDFYKDAITAFNSNQWSSAAANFGKIDPPSAESLYYQGLSLFLNAEYAPALSIFQNELLQNSIYDQEIQWYKALSLILSDQISEGTDELSRIQKDQWKYEEAQKILSASRK